MAAKFKMATKNKFAYVAKKTLVRFRMFGRSQFHQFYRENGTKIKFRRTLERYLV
jgi:hypothetical protein